MARLRDGEIVYCRAKRYHNATKAFREVMNLKDVPDEVKAKEEEKDAY